MDAAVGCRNAVQGPGQACASMSPGQGQPHNAGAHGEVGGLLKPPALRGVQSPPSAVSYSLNCSELLHGGASSAPPWRGQVRCPFHAPGTGWAAKCPGLQGSAPSPQHGHPAGPASAHPALTGLSEELLCPQSAQRPCQGGWGREKPAHRFFGSPSRFPPWCDCSFLSRDNKKKAFWSGCPQDAGRGGGWCSPSSHP